MASFSPRCFISISTLPGIRAYAYPMPPPPTLVDLVLKAHTSFCCIRPAPGSEQLLTEGLPLLFLIAAAAGDPLGEGVECVLVSHAIPVTCLWSHYLVAIWVAIPNSYQTSRQIYDLPILPI